jgi:hypothetical protein
MIVAMYTCSALFAAHKLNIYSDREEKPAPEVIFVSARARFRRLIKVC